MSVKITTGIIGAAELKKAFEELGSEVAGKKSGGLIRNGLQAAGRDVMARMKQEVPKDTGRLKNSIIKFVEKNPRRLNEIVYVGPRLGKSRNDESGAWYAAIVNALGGKGGVGKGYAQRSIDGDKDTQTIQRVWANGIVRESKKIGAENARAVGLAVQRQARLRMKGRR